MADHEQGQREREVNADVHGEVGRDREPVPNVAASLGRNPTPQHVASVLQANRGQSQAILAMLHQTLGNQYVQRVLSMLAGGAAASTDASPAETTHVEENAAAATVDLSAGPAPVRVTTERLNVRSSPDASSPRNIRGGLSAPQVVSTTGKAGDWLEIEHHGRPAFIHGGYVEPVAASARAADAATAAAAATPAASAAPAPSAAPVPSATQAQAAPRASSSTSAPAHAATAAAPAHAAALAPASTAAPAHAAPAHPVLAIEQHTAAPAPVATSTPAVTKAATPAGANTFATLSGTTLAETTHEEAGVLNAVRHSPKRFEPQWLAQVQRKLGVQDATGAFNTETLRAIRTRYGASLTADAIIEEAFLTAIVPGQPYLEVVEGFATEKADPKAKHAGDRAAQAAGYANYRSYRAEFVPITFLGVSLKQGSSDGKGHPHLAARVQAAEAFLRARHPGGDEKVREAIGWNGKGGAAYADTMEDVQTNELSHQHTMGLAIDIDPSQNPWIFATDNTPQMQWWKAWYEDTFAKAARVYGGEGITAANMMKMSKEMSSDELHARISATSSAFTQYMELGSKKNSDATIVDTLMTKGHYTREEALAEVKNVRKVEPTFHGKSMDTSFGRHQAKGLTNISHELLVALRDAGGLDWGGSEMHDNQNGDFMHFDCRHSAFGKAVYDKKAPKKT